MNREREETMTASLIVLAPLLPGKQEAWRQFCQTLQGSRRHHYAGSLQRIGVTRQEVWLSQTMQADLVHLHMQIEQSQQIVTALAASAHPFDRWLRKQLLELHGLDLSQFARAVDELILVWSSDRVAAAAPVEEANAGTIGSQLNFLK